MNCKICSAEVANPRAAGIHKREAHPKEWRRDRKAKAAAEAIEPEVAMDVESTAIDAAVRAIESYDLGEIAWDRVARYLLDRYNVRTA